MVKDKPQKIDDNKFIECPYGCKDKDDKPMMIKLKNLLDHTNKAHPDEIKKQQEEAKPEWQKELDKQPFEYVLVIQTNNGMQIISKPDNLHLMNSVLGTAKIATQNRINKQLGV